MISKLYAKYQFCAIHTADRPTTDGKVHRIRESPSNPRKSIVYRGPTRPINRTQRDMLYASCRLLDKC